MEYIININKKLQLNTPLFAFTKPNQSLIWFENKNTLVKSFAKYPVMVLALILVSYSQIFAPLLAFGIPHVSVKNIRESVHFQAGATKAADFSTPFFEEQEEEEESRHQVRKLLQDVAHCDLFFLQLPEYLVVDIAPQAFGNRTPNFSFSTARYIALSIFRL